MEGGGGVTDETITIIMSLPSKYLSPNYRPRSQGGVIGVGVARKKQKEIARDKVLECCVESAPWQKVETQATFFHANNRRRDGDNFLGRLKGAQDGIVLAGLLLDDTHEQLTALPPKFAKDIDFPRVEIEIRRLA